MSVSLALYQPDMAVNVGAIIRLAACFDMDLHIIEPCGFPWVERKIRQSAMDYYDSSKITKHNDFNAFMVAMQDRRVVLMTTKTSHPYYDFSFKDGDVLLAGSESAGVPQSVHDAIKHRLTIPIASHTRSLNLGMACAIVSSEALRQIA